MDKAIKEKLLPIRIKVDNGPEFISRALDAWAYFNNVKLDCLDLAHLQIMHT
jgi:putative transposase